MTQVIHPLLLSRIEELGGKEKGHSFQAARQVFQELILYALSRGGFFKQASFQGGTALRIVYGTRRFSEDLDFALLESNSDFKLTDYSESIERECEAFGLDVEISPKKSIGAVRRMFVSVPIFGSNSFGLQTGQKTRVKLEVDTNPPSGGQVEMKILPFPLDYPIVIQDMSSLFSGKLHAILCREYDKGRDWFDLITYLNRDTKPNLQLLLSALQQHGPFKGNLEKEINLAWLRKELLKKLKQVDLQNLKADVEKFLFNKRDVDLWSKRYFTEKINLLKTTK